MFRKLSCPPPSSATYVRLPAAPRPRSATPELRPEPRAAENEAAAAAAETAAAAFSRGAVIRSRKPSTGGDRAFMVEFTSGKSEGLE